MKCPKCKGEGVVPHEKRKINDIVDPSDFQVVELCPQCHGSGRVDFDPSTVTE